MIVWNLGILSIILAFPSQVPMELAIALIVVQLIYYLLLIVRIWLGWSQNKLCGSSVVFVPPFLYWIMQWLSQQRDQVQQVTCDPSES